MPQDAGTMAGKTSGARVRSLVRRTAVWNDGLPALLGSEGMAKKLRIRGPRSREILGNQLGGFSGSIRCKARAILRESVGELSL